MNDHMTVEEKKKVLAIFQYIEGGCPVNQRVNAYARILRAMLNGIDNKPIIEDVVGLTASTLQLYKAFNNSYEERNLIVAGLLIRVQLEVICVQWNILQHPNDNTAKAWRDISIRAPRIGSKYIKNVVKENGK